MATDKNILLHPVQNKTIITSVNLYPRTTVTNVLGLDSYLKNYTKTYSLNSVLYYDNEASAYSDLDNLVLGQFVIYLNENKQVVNAIVAQNEVNQKYLYVIENDDSTAKSIPDSIFVESVELDNAFGSDIVYIRSSILSDKMLEKINANKVALRLNYRLKNNSRSKNVFGFTNTIFSYKEKYYKNDNLEHLVDTCLLIVDGKSDIKTNKYGDKYISKKISLAEFVKNTVFWDLTQQENFSQIKQFELSNTLLTDDMQKIDDVASRGVSGDGNIIFDENNGYFLCTIDCLINDKIRKDHDYDVYFIIEDKRKNTFKKLCSLGNGTNNIYITANGLSILNKKIKTKPGYDAASDRIMSFFRHRFLDDDSFNFFSLQRDFFEEFWQKRLIVKQSSLFFSTTYQFNNSSKRTFINFDNMYSNDKKVYFNLHDKMITINYDDGADQELIRAEKPNQYFKKWTYQQFVPSFVILKSNYKEDKKYIYEQVFPLSEAKVCLTHSFVERIRGIYINIFDNTSVNNKEIIKCSPLRFENEVSFITKVKLQK